MTDEQFGWWLVGLVDGEGHFGITRTWKATDRARRRNPWYRSVFRVGMVVDDAPMLRMACDRTGWGAVRLYDRKEPTHRATAVWSCDTRQVLEVVEFFERFPLQSKKATEFAVWAPAARAHAGRARLGRGHIDAGALAVMEAAYFALLEMRGHAPKEVAA